MTHLHIHLVLDRGRNPVICRGTRKNSVCVIPAVVAPVYPFTGSVGKDLIQGGPHDFE